MGGVDGGGGTVMVRWEDDGMTDGLIWSFRGQLILCAVWLVLGLVATVAFTVLVMVRKAPPLTTQRDAVTGVKQHGIGRWVAVLAAVCAGPPVVVSLFVVGGEVSHRVMGSAPWLPPVVVAVLGMVGVGVAVWRRMPRRAPVAVVPPPVVAVPQVGPSGWALPDEYRHGGL